MNWTHSFVKDAKFFHIRTLHLPWCRGLEKKRANLESSVEIVNLRIHHSSWHLGLFLSSTTYAFFGRLTNRFQLYRPLSHHTRWRLSLFLCVSLSLSFVGLCCLSHTPSHPSPSFFFPLCGHRICVENTHKCTGSDWVCHLCIKLLFKHEEYFLWPMWNFLFLRPIPLGLLTTEPYSPKVVNSNPELWLGVLD